MEFILCTKVSWKEKFFATFGKTLRKIFRKSHTQKKKNQLGCSQKKEDDVQYVVSAVPELFAEVFRFAELGPQLLNLCQVLGYHGGDVRANLA